MLRVGGRLGVLMTVAGAVRGSSVSVAGCHEWRRSLCKPHCKYVPSTRPSRGGIGSAARMGFFASLADGASETWTIGLSMPSVEQRAAHWGVQIGVHVNDAPFVMKSYERIDLVRGGRAQGYSE